MASVSFIVLCGAAFIGFFSVLALFFIKYITIQPISSPSGWIQKHVNKILNKVSEWKKDMFFKGTTSSNRAEYFGLLAILCLIFIVSGIGAAVKTGSGTKVVNVIRGRPPPS